MLQDNEIVQELESIPDHAYIWIEIWESPHEITEIAIIVTGKQLFPISSVSGKAFSVCSIKTDEEDLNEFKKYGRRITRLLRRRFPNSEVHSNLRY